MEAVRAAIAKHGHIWSPEVNKEMMALYEPLHAAQAASFKNVVTVEKGLKYGEHARHRLDVYKPTAPKTAGPLPVVVFFHGGAFIAGDTDITPSMHGNIGNFFASHDCVCFLGTYRLLPEARYPSGGEDTTAALKWVQDNASKYGGDSTRVTAVGQSAGAAHLANAAFSGIFAKAGLSLHGLVLMSPPMSYNLTFPRRRKNMFMYHDTEKEEDVMEKTGVAIFRQAEAKDVEGINLLQMVAGLDSDEILDGNLAFVEEHRKKLKRMPLFEVMPGHNHISNTLEIGLPDDLVGKRILDFAQAK